MCIWSSKKSQKSYSCNKCRRLSNHYIKILSVHSLTFFSLDIAKSFKNMQESTNIYKTISLNFSAVHKVSEKEMEREDGERKTGFYTAGIWQSLSLIAWSKIQPRGNKIKTLLYEWQTEWVHRFLTRKWRRAGGKGKKVGQNIWKQNRIWFNKSTVHKHHRETHSELRVIYYFFPPFRYSSKAVAYITYSAHNIQHVAYEQYHSWLVTSLPALPNIINQELLINV